MKWNIEGFNQESALKFKMDCIDLVILRYIVDFENTGLMISKTINNEVYYWINYKKVLEQLPILNMKKDTLYRRLKAMCFNEILKHKTIKEKGSYSFYSFGKNYYIFFCSNYNPKGYCEKIHTPTKKFPDQNIILQENSKIKNINKYKKIVDYLNMRTGCSYKSTTKSTQILIQTRFDEGFIEDDFFKVIDNKIIDWAYDKKMYKFLRPQTLFSDKFETYLNERSCKYARFTEDNREMQNKSIFDFSKINDI